MRFIGGWFGSATADAVNSATPQMMRAKPRALRADMCFSPTLSLRTHNRDLLTAINSRSVLQAGASKRDLAVHFPLTPFNRPKCPYFGGSVERTELSVSLCDESPQ